MKVKISLALILFGFGVMLFPAKLAQIEGLADPNFFEIDGGKLFVADQDKISIYSMTDFKQIKQFGKKGEGPGEYRVLTPFTIYPDQIMISSFGKVLFYSRDGKYINEIKLSNSRIMGLVRLSGKYIGYVSKFNRESRESTTVTAIFDKDINVVKEISSRSRKFSVGMSGKFDVDAVNDYTNFSVYEDKIFLPDTKKGFYIEVLNADGEKLYEIEKEYETLKITQEWKDEYLTKMKENVYYSRFKDRINVSFSDVFPAFKRVVLDNGKIYATTYKRKENKEEVIVMDLKGNIQKTVYVPIADKFTINDGRFYHLEENEDDEEWDLFAEDL